MKYRHVAILLLALLLLVPAMSGHAQEGAQQYAPIEGAFGWPMGTPVEEPETGDAYRTPGSLIWAYHSVTPPSPSRFFEVYSLELTAEERIMVAAHAHKKFQLEAEAERAFRDLEAVLTAKYGPSETQDDWFYKLNREGRSISAFLMPDHLMLGIIYTDEVLKQKINAIYKEQRDAEDKDSL